MKQRIFSVILWMSFIQLMYSCKSTNYLKYHRIVSEAEYSFYHNDYETASYLYNKAFQKVRIPFENDMYYFSASLWEVGEHEKAIALLDTLWVTDYALTKSGFFTDIDTVLRNEIITSNRIKVKDIELIRAASPLLTIFNAIEERDQIARKNAIEIYASYPNDSLKLEKANKIVNETDSLNLLIVDSLIKIHGFIGGVYFPANPKIMHLFIVHKSDWIYNNPKVFLKAIKQGRLLPEDYAVSYDRAMLGYKNDTVVKYGQYTNKLTGVDPEYVFKESKRIGVSPYYKEWLQFPKRKGSVPEKHFYYEYYEANKKQFKCN